MANKKIKGITIQIGADTTGLDTALSGIEKKSKGTKSELAEVSRALKKAPESAELWKQKQELLAKAIQDSREKVKLLEDAQAQVNQQFKEGKIGEEQYRAFQRELEYAKAEVGRFEGELESLNKTAGSTSEDVKNLGDSAEDAGEKAEESGNGGFAVLAGAITAITAAAGAAIKTADEMAQSYDTIAKKTGATGETLESLKDNANNVFSELPTDIDSATTAIGEVNTRFAATGEELENLSKKFIQFAEINDTDLNDSIGTTDKIMEQWGVDIKNIDGLLGMITKKAQDTGISTDTLMKSVQENGATFKEMGFSLEESINLLASFEANGVNAETAIAGLKKSVKNATDEGKPLNEALNETISSIKNATTETAALEAAQELFGTKGAAEMTKAIQEGRFQLTNLSDDMGRYGNVVSSTYESTISPMESLKTAGNEVKVAIAKIGNEFIASLLPAAEKALPKITNGIDWITDNLPEIKDEAKKLIPLITTAGSAFSAWKVASVALKGADAIKKFSSSVSAGNSVMKALNITMSANPAVAVTSAIVALTAAIVALSIAHDNEKTIADKIADSYKEERKKVDETRESINKLKDDFSNRAGEIDAESQRTEALWKELDNLTSATGRVRDADKDRAQYILGELNEALGTEYTMTGNQIDNYNKLTASIEETIEKKKALAYLDAYESKAGEMAELKTTSLEELQQYYPQWQAAKAKMDAAEEEFKQLENGLSPTEVDPKLLKNKPSEAVYERFIAAQAEVNEISPLYQQSKASYQSAVDYFTRLNDAEKAYADNAYSDIEGILYAQKDATKAVLEDAKAADKEKEDVLKKSISNSTIALKAAVETQSQAEIDAAFSTMEEMVRLAKEQNIDISQSFTEDFTKQVTEMIDAGFDISGLTKWGKESGIEVSKVFGTNYTKAIQDQLDKGYDITDLLAWGAASGIDISTEYAEQYYQNVQNQLDQGYDITELLKWGAASGFDISKLFTEEFRDEFMNTLNDEQLGFYQWVLDNEETFREMGHDLGWAFGDGFSSAYTQYIYSENDLIQSTVNSASDAKLRYNGKYATGGYISSGNTAVVAESGPELLEIMNGGVRVTPLTGSARNTAVSPESAEQRTILINNTIHVDKISNDYDVKILAQRLAAEQQRIESGRGQR